jgi:hypothetical protein
LIKARRERRHIDARRSMRIEEIAERDDLPVEERQAISADNAKDFSGCDRAGHANVIDCGCGGEPGA